VTRADFLAAVRELADQLADELYDLVERRSEVVRAAALEVAATRLRADLGIEDREQKPRSSKRAAVTCKRCGEVGHNAANARHRDEVEADEVETDEAVDTPREVVPNGDRFARIEQARARRAGWQA